MPSDQHSQPQREPRPTQLDRAQVVSLLVVVILLGFVTLYVDWIWAKVIALIVFIALVIGLGMRMYRDRKGL